jgi:hypothetical protein
MGYREFYKTDVVSKEATYPGGIGAAVGNFFQTLGKVYSDRKSASDQYKYALEFGNFENDNKLLGEYAKSVTREGKKDYLMQGRPSPSLVEKEQQGLLYAADSKAQYNRWKQLDEEINKRSQDGNDKYYDPNIDRETLKEAAFGQDGTINFYNRGPRLEKAGAMIGKDPRSFKQKLYVADYVKLMGDKEKAVTTGDVNSKSAKVSKSPFWDTKTGKVGVTDDHAIDYLRSDPRVSTHYDVLIDEQLSKEIKQMKASGDPKNSWMNGLSDADIKNELINDPSKNTVTQEDYAMRKRSLARKDLLEAANIQEKTDFESKKDTRATGGLYSNDNISYTPTFYNTSGVAYEAVPGEEGAMNNIARPTTKNYSGPGGILMINKGSSTGKPLMFDIESPLSFNLATGKTMKNTGKTPFNLTGYQLQVYDKKGNPYPITASTPEELNAKISALSPKELQNLESAPRIAMSGYSLDKVSMMRGIDEAEAALNQEYGAAVKDGDQAKVNALTQRMNMLEELKQGMSDTDYSDGEIISLASRNGIIGNRINQLVRAERADIDKINNETGGLNLNDRKKWSQEMNDFYDAYTSVYKSKMGSAPSKPATTASATTAKKTTTKSSNAGKVVVLGPDGKKYLLPKDQVNDAIEQGYKLAE